MTKAHILGIGGAHIDRRGQTLNAHVPAVSNPGIMREEVGGGVFNALRSAVQRDISASLLSIRGGDAAGEAVAAEAARTGISDLSATYLDRSTPSYTALLDDHGDLITGLADMSLYDLAFPGQVGRRKTRDAISAAIAILIDANIPLPGLQRLLPLCVGKPVFAIAVSPAKVMRLAHNLADLDCLFMNQREAAVLCNGEADSDDRMIGMLRDAGLSSGAISRGSSPLLCFEPAGAYTMTPPPLQEVADVTGAGDALAGTTTAALLRGEPLHKALREGMAAARLAIKTISAVPDLNPAAFERALGAIPPAVQLI